MMSRSEKNVSLKGTIDIFTHAPEDSGKRPDILHRNYTRALLRHDRARGSLQKQPINKGIDTAMKFSS